MRTGCVSRPASKQAIGEFLAIVSQDTGDLDRAGLVQSAQEAARSIRGLLGLDLDKHPAGCPINGDKQVAVPSFIRHLRQIFHIH
jgi:hypothetical protein